MAGPGHGPENWDFIHQPGGTPWGSQPGANPPVDYPPPPAPLSAAPFYLPNVIAAIVASVGIVVGSIGTWASLGPLNMGGMDFPGSWGVVTLVLGALSAVALFVEVNWGRTSFSLRWAVPIAWGVLVAGIGCLAIALVNIAKVTSVSKAIFGVAHVAQVGWGLWLVAICSALLCVTGAIVAVLVGNASQDYSHSSQTAWTGGWRWAAIIASAVIFVIALINAYRPLMIEDKGSQQATATETATQTVTEQTSSPSTGNYQPRNEPPPPPAAPETLPPDATRCSSNPVNTPLSNSAAGSEVTSCPFAEAVRAQYLRQGVRDTPVTLNVMSPVTDEIYVMNCIGSQVVTCTGGNDAVVYLY
jgi:hypothetical protein